MKLLGATACLMGLVSVGKASADGGVWTLAGVSGVCEKVIVNGRPDTCSQKADGGNGLVYMHLPNGRALLTLGLIGGRFLSFVGEKDSQPEPTKYWLYLSRVRFGSKATETIANVGGTCLVTMSPDAATWYSVECHGDGEHGAVFQVTFHPDGKRVVPQYARH
jgi:hypothetical protein